MEKTEQNPFTVEVAPAESIIKNELQKQNIEVSKADMIEAVFSPMVTMLRGFEKELADLKKMPIDANTTEIAKALRLRAVKVRTGTAKLHKEQKEGILREGRALDGVKNILELGISGIEAEAEKIEKHFINIEKAAKQKLFNERVELVAQYVPLDQARLIPLGEMVQDAFDNMLNGYKLQHELKQKQERDAAEYQRVEAERKAVEEKRIREENEILRIQNKLFTDRVSFLMGLGAIHTKREDSNGFELTSIDGSRSCFMTDSLIKTCDEGIKYQRFLDAFIELSEHNKDIKQKRWEDEQKQKKITDDKLKKETEARRKLESEAREREQAEENAKREAANEKRRAQRAPDKVKLLTLAEQIELLPLPTLKEDDAKEILLKVQELLAKTVKYLKDQTEKHL